jgi:hypothetical protein
MLRAGESGSPILRPDCIGEEVIMELSKMMTIEASTVARLALGRPVRAAFARWFRTVEGALATCTHYFRAATMYEELRKLPPAELERRGFSHGSLARDLCGLDDRSTTRRGH